LAKISRANLSKARLRRNPHNPTQGAWRLGAHVSSRTNPDYSSLEQRHQALTGLSFLSPTNITDPILFYYRLSLLYTIWAAWAIMFLDVLVASIMYHVARVNLLDT